LFIMRSTSGPAVLGKRQTSNAAAGRKALSSSAVGRISVHLALDPRPRAPSEVFPRRAESVLLQKWRSTLHPGEHVFDGRDSPGLIALGQVDQQPKAVALLSET
jgi:hypothetical protein